MSDRHLAKAAAKAALRREIRFWLAAGLAIAAWLIITRMGCGSCIGMG